MPVKNKLTPEERVLAFMKKHRLVVPSSRLLVGVSGGPDSVCLLHILTQLRDKLGIELYVAHLNHQLRGDESRADAEYVRLLAKQLELPVTIEENDVKKYHAEKHLSLEEAAREVRYQFFATTAKRIGADAVAVGHTTDDHVETILMHLIRGAGVRGLRGLLPVNRWQSSGFAPSAPLGTSQDKSVKLGINVIRPILLLTREETAAYCRQHDLNPRTDTSNLSLSPFRNRIRLRLLPLLKEYNPEIVEALVRTARIAQDDMAFLESDAAKAWEKVARKEQNNIVFEKKKFLALPLALQRELLLKGIETLVGTLKDIELVHIEEVIDAMRKPAGRVIILPDSLEFVIEYERFVLGKDPAALSPFPQLRGEFKLNVPGTTKLPGWVVTVTVVPPDVLKRDVADYKAYLDFEKTGKDLTVRSRQPGDRFHPMGMTEPKKLNQFMVDSKIPHLWRERIPVVCSPEQIVWVVGYRIDERVKVMPETKQLLELKFRRV